MTLFTFMDGLLFSLLSIVLVILLIALIIWAISPLKRLSPQKQVQETSNEEKPHINRTISDPTMMVAALIASIDYREETGKEPYLKSIREIEQ
ncbi:hypothetical protein KHQ88_04685 [Mycoplasmatota bacterium]|nr:hypothetical protein KHQ88_04685 [Mycoplasmatota bacterium]